MSSRRFDVLLELAFTHGAPMSQNLLSHSLDDKLRISIGSALAAQAVPRSPVQVAESLHNASAHGAAALPKRWTTSRNRRPSAG